MRLSVEAPEWLVGLAARLHRPGAAAWTTLTRRTPLSQGVPSLGIFEALRAPGERGIAQYR